MNSTRKISYRAVEIGVLLCIFASIWDVSPFKWILTAMYLLLVARYFGVSIRSEKVVGHTIFREEKNLNILNMRNKSWRKL
jgi:hypothetical protein